MIDWHSHILPSMDDGSNDIQESICMLNALKSQGIECVIATPHFYANEESVDDFLIRRKKSYDLLFEKLNDGFPSILCGAEVKYYSGIAKMKELDKLAIENKKILLLEMPTSRWTEYTIKELHELSNTRGLTIVIAHIERYLALQENRILERLCENGLLMQANASFFNHLGSRRKALKLLDSGIIHFIGSDCHNMTTRAPQISSAYELIKRKFGEDYFSRMNEYGYRVLKHK